MNIALFFEGTGQGVHGRKTNVSRVYEACVRDGQELHLESGPGTHVGYFLSGRAAGHDWRRIFADAKQWFENETKSSLTRHLAASEQGREHFFSDAARRRVNTVFLFGFSRGALLARHFAAWLNEKGVPVEYLGLWDTVDAIPDLEVAEECPPNVAFARHAVAENESRRFYEYVPLLTRHLAASEKEDHLLFSTRRDAASTDQVEERLFPGVHSDVGGLYKDNHELADAACAWIAQGAAERGLKFVPGSFPENPVCRSATAVRHDETRHLSNLFGLLRPVQRIFPASLRRISDEGVRAVVSLGSNVEPRAKYLKQALAALSQLPETRLVRASSVLETEPVDVPAEFSARKFLNQAAVFETKLSAEEFSRRMHAIEDDLGRVRTVRNGPRTIDIDLIDFGGLVLDTPELTLPHPRAHLRDFVLKPLEELGSRSGLSRFFD